MVCADGAGKEDESDEAAGEARGRLTGDRAPGPCGNRIIVIITTMIELNISNIIDCVNRINQYVKYKTMTKGDCTPKQYSALGRLPAEPSAELG